MEYGLTQLQYILYLNKIERVLVKAAKTFTMWRERKRDIYLRPGREIVERKELGLCGFVR